MLIGIVFATGLARETGHWRQHVSTPTIPENNAKRGLCHVGEYGKLRANILLFVGNRLRTNLYFGPQWIEVWYALVPSFITVISWQRAFNRAGKLRETNSKRSSVRM